LLHCTKQTAYNKNDSSTSAPGVFAMQNASNQHPAMEVDVMEVWAKRAQQQRAAFDALAAYMRQQ
jgi:hypothetical protein|tara:strand:+ start:210 stop:404 length:195 start_codon:yes stop_codon:yes gene_type:complete